MHVGPSAPSRRRPGSRVRFSRSPRHRGQRPPDQQPVRLVRVGVTDAPVLSLAGPALPQAPNEQVCQMSGRDLRDGGWMLQAVRLGSTSEWSPADDCRGRLGPEPPGPGRAWRALSYPNKHHVGQLGFRLAADAHKEPEWVTPRGLVPPTRMCWPSSWLWLGASHCPIPRLMMSCIVGWYPSAMMNSVSRIHPRSPADEPMRLSSEHRPTRGSKCARS